MSLYKVYAHSTYLLVFMEKNLKDEILVWKVTQDASFYLMTVIDICNWADF